uniref:Large ribosomal subunit protein uL24c n=1 Tax=Hildenbrandia rubra TaxID=31481 RepID=A0A1C9CGB1_9FLOR|nr:ribosomal protein L24 [Hildenbrandia rubra]AOM67423.1 ribosomal protein L24 [Hildenbrandia rubra]
MIKINLRNKIHVKKGDIVKIITGKEKGKVGTVIQVFYKVNKIIIENINVRIKHIKSKQKQDAGQIIKLEMPIHSSNVMLYSEKTRTASRYGCNITNNPIPIKNRILKKTQEIIT